jgi:hypothetical protein
MCLLRQMDGRVFGRTADSPFNRSLDFDHGFRGADLQRVIER